MDDTSFPRDGEKIEIGEFLQRAREPAVAPPLGDEDAPAARRPGRPRKERFALPRLSGEEFEMWELAEAALKTSATLPVEVLAKMIAAAGFQLKYNSVLCRHEVNGAAAHEGSRPAIMSALRVFGEKSGSQICQDVCSNRGLVGDAIEYAFEQNRYNPLHEWLFRLAERTTDGYYGDMPEAERPLAKLCAHMKDAHGNLATFLRRWLIGCLARLDGKHAFQNYTLVLKGPQGIGKSYFARWLCSVGLEYFQEGMLIPSDKDHKLRLAQKWIWAVDEFGATDSRKAQLEMKAFLTVDQVNERPPYARFAQQMPRVCNLIATTNDAAFLNDPSGSRRYLVLDMTHIDQDYAKTLKADDVWAEVAHYWLMMRERPELTPDEVKRQRAANEAHEQEDAVAEWLRATIVPEKGASIDQTELYRRAFGRFSVVAGDSRRESQLRNEIRQLLTAKWRLEQHKSNGVRRYYDVAFRKE